jgi:type I restriction enzyme S subunit
MGNNTNTYKQTAIGLIPSDWEVKKLKDFGKVYTGNTPDTTDRENYGNEFMFVSPFDLGNNKYILKTEKMLSEKGFSKSRQFPKGSVLFTCIGSTIGKSGIAIKALTSNQQINAIVVQDEFSNEFLYYELENNFEKIKLMAGEQAVPIINKSQFESINLRFPPLPEQQKIATILSTWDIAIDNCKAIIDKLKDRNKGLAQQLLTGKTRVKGFEKTKWEWVAINKIAKEISLKNPSDKELIVMSCTKYDGLVPSLEYFGRKIYSDDLTTYKIVKKGQFAYATNHIEEGSIGYQTKCDEALISPMYTVFQTDNTINDNLLFRILKSHEYIHQYQKRMEGSIDRRGGLRWDEFSKIKVPVIDFEEQNAINNILDTATAEFNQYQQKLQTLQLQKKGLMQQLLTGKTKVI